MASQKRQRKGFWSFLLMFFKALWMMFVGLFAFMGFFTVVAIVGWLVITDRLGPTIEAKAQERVSSAFSDAWPEIEPTPDRPHVIYLNREGATLTAGSDDSTRNESSVVANAGMEQFEVASYHGSNATWNNVVSCVQDQFEAYDVQVVDQRPVDGPFTMVMVGGRPGDLANSDAVRGINSRNLSGLAPMNGSIVEDAVVFVFSRNISGGSRVVCETAAHEVGHVFGLDHEMNRRDPMSYLPRGSRRSFQDAEAQCGERAARLCSDGEASQNSHQHLLEVLGPNRQQATAQ